MQQNQSGLKLYWTHHYLFCADNVNLMGEKLRVEHESFFSFILIYIQQDATLHSLFYLETALHVLGGTTKRIRSANNCIYSIWYLSQCYCYLLLLWELVRTPPTAHSNQFKLFHDSGR